MSPIDTGPLIAVFQAVNIMMREYKSMVHAYKALIYRKNTQNRAEKSGLYLPVGGQYILNPAVPVLV